MIILAIDSFLDAGNLLKPALSVESMQNERNPS